MPPVARRPRAARATGADQPVDSQPAVALPAAAGPPVAAAAGAASAAAAAAAAAALAPRVDNAGGGGRAPGAMRNVPASCADRMRSSAASDGVRSSSSSRGSSVVNSNAPSCAPSSSGEIPETGTGYDGSSRVAQSQAPVSSAGARDRPILDGAHSAAPGMREEPESQNFGAAVDASCAPSELSLANSGHSARLPDDVVDFDSSAPTRPGSMPDTGNGNVGGTSMDVRASFPTHAQDRTGAHVPSPAKSISDTQGKPTPQLAQPVSDQTLQALLQPQELRPHGVAVVREARGHDWALGAMASLVDTARDSARTAVRIDVWYTAGEPEHTDDVENAECDLDSSETTSGQEPYLVLCDDGPGLDGNGMRRRLAAGTADAPAVPPPSASSPLSATPWLAACFRIGRDVCVLSKTAPSVGMHGPVVPQHGDHQSSDGFGDSRLAFGRRRGSQHFALLSRTAIADGSLKGGVVVDWDSKESSDADVADLLAYTPWNRAAEIDEAFRLIGECGVLVALFNLRRDPDDGELELDFVSDETDILLAGPSPASGPALRTSLRSYLQVLYLDLPEDEVPQPRLYLRNAIVRESRMKHSLLCPRDYKFNLTRNFHDECKYRFGLHPSCGLKVSPGWANEIYPELNGEQGLLVYHCGRLIWPFVPFDVLDSSRAESPSSELRFDENVLPIVGVVEADMWTPTPNFQGFIPNDFYRNALLSLRQSLVDYVTQLKLAGPLFGIDTGGPADRWIRCDACGAWRILMRPSFSNMSDVHMVPRWTCTMNECGTNICGAPDDLEKVLPIKFAEGRSAYDVVNDNVIRLKRSGRLMGIDPVIDFEHDSSAKRARNEEQGSREKVQTNAIVRDNEKCTVQALGSRLVCDASTVVPVKSSADASRDSREPAQTACLEAGRCISNGNALSPGVLEIDLNAHTPEPQDVQMDDDPGSGCLPRIVLTNSQENSNGVPCSRYLKPGASECNVDLTSPLFSAGEGDVTMPIREPAVQVSDSAAQAAAIAKMHSDSNDLSAPFLPHSDGQAGRCTAASACPANPLRPETERIPGDRDKKSRGASAHKEAAVALVAMKAAMNRESPDVPEQRSDSGHEEEVSGRNSRSERKLYDSQMDKFADQSECPGYAARAEPSVEAQGTGSAGELLVLGDKAGHVTQGRDTNQCLLPDAGPHDKPAVAIGEYGATLGEENRTKNIEAVNPVDGPSVGTLQPDGKTSKIVEKLNLASDTSAGQPCSEGSKGPTRESNGIGESGFNQATVRTRDEVELFAGTDRRDVPSQGPAGDRRLAVIDGASEGDFWRKKYLALVSSLVPEHKSRLPMPLDGAGPDDVDDLRGEVLRQVEEREEEIRREAQSARASQQIACESLDNVRRLIRVFLERGVGIVRPEDDDDEPIESHFGAYLRMIDVLGANAEGFL